MQAGPEASPASPASSPTAGSSPTSPLVVDSQDGPPQAAAVGDSSPSDSHGSARSSAQAGVAARRSKRSETERASPGQNSQVQPKEVVCPLCLNRFHGLKGHRCPVKNNIPANPNRDGAASQSAPQVSPAVRSWPFSALSNVSYDSIFCSPLTICDVPLRQVGLFSCVVSELIKYILNGEKEAWKAFFLLPRLVFALPRGGRSTEQLVCTFLTYFRKGEWESLLARKVRCMGNLGPGASKARRAEALARAGRMSCAARALSDGALCDLSDDNDYNVLKGLHPIAEQRRAEPRLKSADVLPEQEFLRAVTSMPARLAPDAAGWRGEYFKCLGGGAKDLLFKLCQHILQNPKSLPAELQPFLFGARLIAIPKPGGGLRPIAVGTILRKVISQTLAYSIAPLLPEFFRPLQYGVGIKGGAEDVVQGLRLAMAKEPAYAVAGIDFSNAFNSVERSVIAARVEKAFPQLMTWFELSYGRPSKLLVHNRDPITSERGVQQGDPLGPFLFALALQPALVRAAKDGNCCVMAYLDDVFICGNPDSIASVAEKLIDAARAAGLSCNVNKCWATKRVVVKGHQLGLRLKPEVLGAPLDLSQKLSPSVIPRVQRVAELSDTQIALHLLRFIHNSRFTYSFRLSSGEASRELASEMTKETRDVLRRMLRREELPAASWRQALLPMGPGLGFTNLEAMAPYMAFASILESAPRLADLDPDHFLDFTTEEGWDSIRSSPIQALYADALEAAKGLPEDEMRYAKLQNLFAKHIVEPKALEDFLSSPENPDSAKAIVASTKNSPVARQFLCAIPSTRSLSLSPRQMKISLCLLLGVKLDMASKTCTCKAKGGPVPLTMYHALSCKSFGGLIYRHDLVKEEIGNLCKAARLAYEYEPHRVIGPDGRRPDLMVIMASNDQDVVLDVTIHSPLRDKYAVANTIQDEQHFLERADQAKRQKYQQECDEKNLLFFPIVLSAFGGILKESLIGLKVLLEKTKRQPFAPPNWAASSRKAYWYQRIAIALWSGNACKLASFMQETKPVA